MSKFDSEHSRLDSLTGLRFIAALLVILNHSAWSRDGGIVEIQGLEWVARLGRLGVPFFFALSGFVLTWSWRPGGRVRDFYQRRFARVYPLHAATWAIVALSILASGMTIPTLGGVLSLLLLQSWVPDTNTSLAVNSVSWTLSCELFFYALTPLLLSWLISRPASALRVAASAVGLMTVAAILQAEQSGLFSTPNELWFFPPFALGFFLMGLACGVAFRQGFRSRIPLWAGLAFAAFNYEAITFLNMNWMTWFGGRMPQSYTGLMFIPGIAVLLASTVSHDLKAHKRSWLSHPAMVRLGEWSFALYLTHPLITRALDKVADVNPQGLAQNVALEAAFVLAAVGLSAVAYHTFERPLESWLRPRRSGVRATAELPSSWSKLEPLPQE